jgi:transposase
MLGMLAKGVDRPERLADAVMGQLRQKMPQLLLALEGRTDEHFRWMLEKLLRKLERLDGELADVDTRLNSEMAGHAELIEHLCTIPGIDRITAQVLIAELGTDMSQFPTASAAAGVPPDRRRWRLPERGDDYFDSKTPLAQPKS